MSGPTRREVEALFEAALARPPEERGRWLETACRGDGILRREVEALLRAHERAEGVLEADLAPPPSLAGLAPELDRVGRYRVVGELARGGMGAVYLADRDDGLFRQRVAVKVLRRSAHVQELRPRFEAERQILAALEHPHIARLLDGGITDDGRPFLVMEYVEGRPVDEYCEAEGLGLEDRLRLFCEVARAVHYAHGRLVVHRDLKPSNVLVTDAGEPKLLDFSIAKILDPGALGLEAPETRTGLRLMTPEYAAPEQVLGEPATTAVDVYGLGVVLYELLAGRRPFHLEGCTAGEAERVLLHEDPAPPSERAEGRAGAGPGAAGGGPGGRRWRRRLEGDLDRIVLKALRKEPERRYVSAGQMAEDVERHLEGRPVRARGESLAYRGRTFVRRHLLGLASAAAVLAALVAGTVLATVGMVRAERAEAVARREAASARQVSRFLVELFEVSDPGEARGTTVTAREILDRGAERVSRDLEAQPLVQARLMGTVGEIYRRLGLYGASRPLLERTLEVRRRELGAGHPEVADALHDLGHVLEQQGHFGESAERYAGAVALRERLGPDERIPLARSLTGLAAVRLRQGRIDDAAGLLDRAAGIHESAGDAAPVDLAWTLHELGSSCREQGRWAEAESHLRRALEIQASALPPDHPGLAATRRELAGALRGLGRGPEADSLDHASERLGPVSPPPDVR